MDTGHWTALPSQYLFRIRDEQVCLIWTYFKQILIFILEEYFREGNCIAEDADDNVSYNLIQKTPSQMDVAPWIANWIMMVSDGIRWY